MKGPVMKSTSEGSRKVNPPLAESWLRGCLRRQTTVGLAACIALVTSSCSLLNQENGPQVHSCADLGGKSACKDNIIAACVSGELVFTDCAEESKRCSNASGEYKCVAKSEPDVPEENPCGCADGEICFTDADTNKDVCAVCLPNREKTPGLDLPGLCPNNGEYCVWLEGEDPKCVDTCYPGARECASGTCTNIAEAGNQYVCL